MVGRPREFDIDAARDEAMQLFWTQGFEATSMADLLAVMAISKSSFYQTFESKQILFEQCLQRYGELLVEQMSNALNASPKAIDFISSALEMVASETRGPLSRRGCLLMNTAAEFAQRDAHIGRAVKQGVEALACVFKQAVERAIAASELRADCEPEVLANYLVSSISGLKTMVKAGIGEQEILAVARISVASLPLR